MVVSVGVVIGGNGLSLLWKQQDRSCIEGPGRIILLVAGDVVNLIVVIVKKARDSIATTAIDLEISFKQTFTSNYAEKVKTTSTYLARIAHD